MPLVVSIAGRQGERATNVFGALTTLEGLARQSLLSQAGTEPFLSIVLLDYKPLTSLHFLKGKWLQPS